MTSSRVDEITRRVLGAFPKRRQVHFVHYPEVHFHPHDCDVSLTPVEVLDYSGQAYGGAPLLRPGPPAVVAYCEGMRLCLWDDEIPPPKPEPHTAVTNLEFG